MRQFMEARRLIEERIKELQDIGTLSNTYYPEHRHYDTDNMYELETAQMNEIYIKK